MIALTRSRILHLSLAQGCGLVVTTLGSVGVWFVAASITRPADLGMLGRVISTGTLVASLLTAGLGQFLLTIVRGSSTAHVRRFFVHALVGGVCASALVAFLVTLFQSEYSLLVALTTALMAAGVALTNLQDGIYLSTGQARDVPFKSATLVLGRLLVLLLCSLAPIDFIGVVSVFVLTQIGVGLGWIFVRIPVALQQHAIAPSTAVQQPNARIILAVSYIYAIAVALVSAGVPAIITSSIAPRIAGPFYIAWTIASLLGSVSIAVANSIVAITLDGGQKQRRFISLLFGMFAILSIGALFITIVAPFGLERLHGDYGGIQQSLVMLAIGDVFFGLAIISVAVYRSCATFRQIAFVLSIWPFIIIVCVIIGIHVGDMQGSAQGFALGNAVSAWVLCSLTIRSIHTSSHYRSTTSLGA